MTSPCILASDLTATRTPFWVYVAMVGSCSMGVAIRSRMRVEPEPNVILYATQQATALPPQDLAYKEAKWRCVKKVRSSQGDQCPPLIVCRVGSDLRVIYGCQLPVSRFLTFRIHNTERIKALCIFLICNRQIILQVMCRQNSIQPNDKGIILCMNTYRGDSRSFDEPKIYPIGAEIVSVHWNLLVLDFGHVDLSEQILW